MSEPERPITQEEMMELFGSTMPIEAVNLVFDAPGDMTIGQIRSKLKEMAAKEQGRREAIAERQERMKQMEACITAFIRANDEAPEFGMCDCIDNEGEHYQSADLAAHLIDARMLLWGGDHAPTKPQEAK